MPDVCVGTNLTTYVFWLYSWDLNQGGEGSIGTQVLRNANPNPLITRNLFGEISALCQRVQELKRVALSSFVANIEDNRYPHIVIP